MYWYSFVHLYQARAQWSPLEEPKLGSEVDFSSFTASDTAQRHCAAPAIVHVPGTGHIASTTKYGPALQKDGGGLASRLGIRGSDPELRQ